MQFLELDLLKEFDRVCRKHDIKYTISSGTLLGAIRHKGFMSWDDDADISMLREEYNKFRTVANEMDPEIGYFQDHFTDSEYRWGYAKLRHAGTEYVRIGQEHLKNKTGIFVDIFPLDDVPESKIGKILQRERCFVTRKIMYSEVGRLSDSESPAMRRFYTLLLKIPLEYAFYRLGKYAKKSSNSTPNVVRTLMFDSLGKNAKKLPEAIRYGRPKEWFLNRAEYEFEGCLLFGPANFDDYLKFRFGDYLELAPEDKRHQNSHVSYIDFGDGVIKDNR